MAARRSLRELHGSGKHVSTRELLGALRAAGFAVVPTSKPTHLIVRCGSNRVTIAERGGTVLKVYVSLVVNRLGYECWEESGD